MGFKVSSLLMSKGLFFVCVFLPLSLIAFFKLIKSEFLYVFLIESKNFY